MKENKAVKSILKYFEIKDGCLLIGGKTCSEIADEIGTPYYAYDLNVIKQKIASLREELPDNIKIHYAIKANPHPKIISFVNKHVDGFDVASKGELDKAIAAGVDPSTIGFAGPGKQQFEIEAACIEGIGSLNAESVTELERADRIARNLKRKINVSLRVNPSYEMVGSGMRMGGDAKPFGIDQRDIPDVLQKFDQWSSLEFKGFHIFAGSQNLNQNLIVSAFENALDAVLSFLPYCPTPPSMVNLGGGFGIPYYQNDEALDMKTVGEKLSTIFGARTSEFKDIEMIVETGRYLVGESGIYVSKIIDKKESRGETFIVTNGGMHHHLAASGNFGQVIKRNFPIIFPELLDKEYTKTLNIVGPLCTPLDKFATKAVLPDPEINDLVAVLASGAYGYSASPKDFLGHSFPKEVVQAISKKMSN